MAGHKKEEFWWKIFNKEILFKNEYLDPRNQKLRVYRKKSSQVKVRRRPLLWLKKSSQDYDIKFLDPDIRIDQN